MLNKERQSKMGGIGEIAVQEGMGLVGGLINKIGQKRREKRQMGYQTQLMDLQQKNQMALNRQGSQLAYDMWLKTGPVGEMQQLKEAGLNPGLMYGGSGPGGTTSAGSGGGAVGGQAPRVENIPYDIMTAQSMAKLTKELQIMEEQRKNIKADTENKESGTALNFANVERSLAETLTTKSMERLNNLSYEVGMATKDDQIDRAHYEVEEMISRKNLNDENAALARAKVLTEGVQRNMYESNIRLNDTKVEETLFNMMIEAEKLGILKRDIAVKEKGVNLTEKDLNRRLTMDQWQTTVDQAKIDLEWEKLTQKNAEAIMRMLSTFGLGGVLGNMAKGGRTVIKGFGG